MAVLFIDVYRHIKMYIYSSGIFHVLFIYVNENYVTFRLINTFINDFPPNNRARESVQRQQKLIMNVSPHPPLAY